MTSRFFPRQSIRMLLALGGGLLAAALVWAQGGGQSSQSPPAQQTQTAPGSRIFTGKITLVNSSQKAETAGAGFKGVGEDGQVQKAVLSTQPNAGIQQKVTQLAAFRVSDEELAAFLQEGGLRRQNVGRGGRQ